MDALMQFINDEEGLTAIEYVISASLLVAGLTLLFSTFGTDLQAKFIAIISRIV